MKKIVNTIAKVSGGVTALALFAERAYAASASDYLGGLTFGPGGSDLIGWIKGLLNFMIAVSGLIAVVMLIVAGYSFITAGGDEDKVGKATKSLTYAIVGLAICLISVLIVNFVVNKIQNPSA